MIGKRFQKSEVGNEEYIACAEWCNKTQQGMIVDMGDFYECEAIPEPSPSEILRKERDALEDWLRGHDYIGTKIATGRATVEEYATEIAKMTAKANRINEIDKLLKV